MAPQRLCDSAAPPLSRQWLLLPGSRWIHGMRTGMSSHRRVPIEEPPVSLSLARMDFWDGMELSSTIAMVTAEEQRAVWDAVAASIRQQLLLRKGIRIPTLGSFDVVSTRTQVGNKPVILRMPAFRVAWSLGSAHNLMDNGDLPGDKELEPLHYSKVAAAARVSRRKARCCILGTTSLLSRCLGKGWNVALLLRDLGMLLIADRRVQMSFHPAFLHRITGNRSHGEDATKSLRLLCMAVPIASRTFPGNVVVFPEFQLELVSKATAGKLLKSLGAPHPLGTVPNEAKEEEEFPPDKRDAEVPGMLCALPLLPSLSSAHVKHKKPWDKKGKDQDGKDQEGKEKGKDQDGKDQKGKEKKGKDQEGKKGKDQDGKDQEGKKGKDQEGKKGKDQDRKDPEGKKGKDQEGKKKKGKDQEGKDQEGKKGTDQDGKKKKGKDLEGKKGKDQDGKDQEMKKDKAQLRQLPAIPKGSSGKEGKAGPWPRVQTQGSQWSSGIEREARSSEVGKRRKCIYKVFIPQDPGPDAARILRARPELFWSVLKEPQRAVLAGYRFPPSLPVFPSYKGSGSMRSTSGMTCVE